MTDGFLFLCPNGCRLQGDPANAGQSSQCPLCGAAFVIPHPPTTDRSGPPSAGPGFPQIVSNRDATRGFAAVEQEPDVLHIPCPNGHVLDCPRAMLNQPVLCPHCRAQFLLREKDSQEHQRRRQIQEEGEHRRLSRAWLHFAVVTAVLAGIAILIALFLTRQ